MTRDEHCPDSLGAYVLGALDPDETRAVDDHLATCVDCRADLAELRDVRDSLRAVPPEAFLDGPPTDGHLLLSRAFQQIRTEKRAGTRTRRMFTAAAAVVAVGLAVGGGILFGRSTDSERTPVALPPPATSTTAPGTMHLHGTAQGAQLNATVTPVGNWVKIRAWVAGIPAGEKCRLVVVARSGKGEIAGSWVVSSQAVAHGVTLDGAALVPGTQVRAVEVQDLAGQTFVSASSP